MEGATFLDPDACREKQGDTSPRSVRLALGIAAVIVVVTILDQVTKIVAVEWLGPDVSSRRWELAGRYLALEYVENTGAAFGILAGRTWLLSMLALAVAGWFVLVYGRFLAGNRWMQGAVGLVLGGAAGNLLDRLRLGYVVDFIAVGNWPKFNLADSAITVGLLILFIIALRDEGPGSVDA